MLHQRTIGTRQFTVCTKTNGLLIKQWNSASKNKACPKFSQPTWANGILQQPLYTSVGITVFDFSLFQTSLRLISIHLLPKTVRRAFISYLKFWGLGLLAHLPSHGVPTAWVRSEFASLDSPQVEEPPQIAFYFLLQRYTLRSWGDFLRLSDRSPPDVRKT